MSYGGWRAWRARHPSFPESPKEPTDVSIPWSNSPAPLRPPPCAHLRRKESVDVRCHLCAAVRRPTAAQPIQRETHVTTTMTQQKEDRPAAAEAIRPFTFRASDEELAELKRRILATRWPERETVSDDTQGVQLATAQKLARYWATEYDWRTVEARLSSYPHFITEIDGLDIHFIHVRSKHENALPMIINHGWPGSVIEQLKIIGPLTDPTSYGGKPEDAFDVVIPSMPGYGFSGKPTTAGWGPERIARAWATLMERLGYQRYTAQGGDWGALIVDQMGVQEPQGLVGIHTNLARGVPPEVNAAAFAGAAPPPGLDEEETEAFN